MALPPFADPAGNPDRLVGGWRAKVHVIGVDEGGGMAHLAAQTNRVASDWGVKGAARFTDIAGKAEVPHPVRRFGKLA